MVGKIDRNSALFVANNLMEKIKEYCEDYEIVGSIRRKKDKVHDIDIVVKVKDRSEFKRKFRMLTWIDPELKRFKIKKAGPKLISGVYMNVPVDIYITTEENYEGTKLIRTGSAEFNRMLCSIALKKGWKLCLWRCSTYRAISVVYSPVIIYP